VPWSLAPEANPTTLAGAWRAGAAQVRYRTQCSGTAGVRGPSCPPLRAAPPQMERAVAHMEATGVPPQRVAACVVEALTSARPRARYLVGATAPLDHVLKRLAPDWIADPVMLWRLGLMAGRVDAARPR
jgi:hypothetical protein